jgi:hypothetical protein
VAVIEINWKPGTRELRQFAAIWLVAFGVFGALVAWRTGAIGVPMAWVRPWVAPFVLWIVAALVGLVGLVAPAAVRPVYVAWMAMAFPIGWVISHLLLVVTYFGLFTLVSLIFKLIGRDVLHRRFDRAAQTYWVRRTPPADVSRYFKQF